ncbi:ABC transporter ATP-binding protein/permease [Halosquirtibacter laminarini]|uniref:ABC transporter ATP-binding protein/permease n=1 Tax=Halosquirtibacter laminarini TaxID=3374600 RepID=A0AC61NJ46_9BACT|nr:ABC transporter ATP-binding protein/permease [Prolixibacteraceae bacterium]
MKKYIQKRFAMSAKGASDLIIGIGYTTLQNIAIMLPMIFLFIFMDQYFPLEHQSNFGSPWSLGTFILVAFGMMGVIYGVSLLQYDSVYTKVYNESSQRRISLAEKLRKLPLSFFGKRDLSDLSTTLMNDATDLEHIFSHAVPQLIASLVTILIASIGLFSLNWQLSLALLWVVPISFFFIAMSKKKIDKINISLYGKKQDVAEKIFEGVDLVQEIKAYNQEGDFDRELEEVVDRYEASLLKEELLTGAFVNASQMLIKLGLPSVILVGGWMVMQHQVSIFVYLIFLTLGTQIFNPIHEVFNNFAALLFINLRIKRFQEIHDIEEQKGDDDVALENFNIEFDQVSFSYEKESPVLSNVSFTAKQGEITALIGPSGGGKSTATKLAARFWDVKSGAIKLGDIPINTIAPETLLKYYSIVFQDVVLFNSTIRENIRLGRKGASDEEVVNAAKFAQCHDFIEAMPNGYDTVLSENGSTISGGERQRVSIARALLKDAPIILLDEATAALDVENESKIQLALNHLVKNKTVIIIAHKMRTIAGADKVVVLDKGKVVEMGKPLTLYKDRGVFYHMAQKQELILDETNHYSDSLL